MQQSGIRPPPIAYTVLIFQIFPSASNPSATIITTSIGQDKELSNSVKIYIDDAKCSGYNDSFTFKLANFYDICSRADIPSEAKIKVFSTIFKDLALANYSSNIDIRNIAINSDQVRYSIKRK